MLPYWIILMVSAFAAILSAANLKKTLIDFSNSLSSRTEENSLGLKLFVVLLAFMIGFRHQVGGDWYNYLPQIEAASQLSFLESATLRGDPAYSVLVWLSTQLGLGVYGVNWVSATFFALGLYVFVIHSPQPWLALSVSIPYLVIVVAMGYTRQGIALGFVMMGLVSLQKGSILKFAGWLAFAAVFHKSAVILIPLAIFSGKKNWWALVGVMIIGLLMFFILLAEHVDTLISGYITDQYESSGATIRIAMNALPAIIYLIFRNRFKLNSEQQSFWTWLSLGALIFILLLIVTPSSTAVDRVALYWIPLQLFVWSRLPLAMSNARGSRMQWTSLVLLYTFVVQYVWLFYADYSYAWLPYKFYPWIWLWN
jgi:hypothetical protein